MIADKHNFSRRVSRHKNDWIEKPRYSFGEWIFLSLESKLRIFLNSILYSENTNLKFLNILKFKNFNFKLSLKPNEIEFLDLNPYTLDNELTLEQAQYIGTLLGIISWFGLGDLHGDNILMGENKKTLHFQCTPIDIEVLFENYNSISSSLIFGKFGSNIPEAGFSKIKRCFEKSPSLLIDLIESYSGTLHILNNNTKEIEKIIEEYFKKNNIYSRLVIRDTYKYQSQEEYNNLFKEEITQLSRGDIPYFIRRISDNSIFYWKDEYTPEMTKFKINDVSRMMMIDTSCYFGNHIERRCSIEYIKKSIVEIITFFTEYKENFTTTKNFNYIIKSNKNYEISINSFVLEWNI